VGYFIEDWQGDLQFAVLLDLESEDIGEGVDADHAEIAVSRGVPPEETEGWVCGYGVRNREDLLSLW
jgi:hypothetical protein